MKQEITNTSLSPDAPFKVRRDSVYHQGKIIARYDVEQSPNGAGPRETISFFARSGLRIATAFVRPHETTCRILTEKDQHEHFIDIDIHDTDRRIGQVVSFLLLEAYLMN